MNSPSYIGLDELKLSLGGEIVRRWILLLLLLSSTVIADKAGLVVQFDNFTIIKKCIEFQSGASALDVLGNSGLQIVTKDYGAGLGVALCKIGDVGCSADNCFCQSQYWGFYYIVGGNWEYAPVGISGYTVRNGDVLGFRWGVYGDKPELHSFDEVCPSPAMQRGQSEPIKYFMISMNGNCSNEPFFINVREKDKKQNIWNPTNFFLAKDLSYIDVEYGVGTRVLLHQVYFGKDAGFEKVAVLFTDKEGNASFIPNKPGGYRLEFEKEGFLGEEREIDISECKGEMASANKSVEEPRHESKGTEPNITRIDITAPATAEVNDSVIVSVTSETGKPLANERIVVEFSGNRKEITTNESGKAIFTAEKEGVYVYSSPDHTLSAYRLTNVIESTKIALKSQEAMPLVQRVETSQSVGMVVANPLPNTLTALAGGVIVLVLLFIFKKARS